MENEKKERQDTTKINEHKDMPVKTVGTDQTKNTAGEEGLNQARTTSNDIEPGTKSKGPDSTETD